MKTKIIILFSLFFLFISGLCAQIYPEEARNYDRNFVKNLPVLTIPANQRYVVLPDSVDNSLNKYCPLIFSQIGFSCQQVAAVNYCYAYEMNRLRDLQSVEWKNAYPGQYTYNFMNNAERFKGVSFFYSWDVIKRQGHPTAQHYPDFLKMDILGWLSGYDSYFSGMKNRLRQVFALPVNTAEGINTVKRYLYDHLDGSPTGGIVMFGASGNFSLSTNWKVIPEGSPHAGNHVLTGFYPNATHGMTIVGYNDSVRFDVNGDGIFTNDTDINGDGQVDPKDWEIGAFRMMNSYGYWWGDNGFGWIMYRAMALGYDDALPGWSADCGVWNESVYAVEPLPDYSPLLTMKVKLHHTLRNCISIKAGISSDPQANLPEHVMEFPTWNYQGSSYAVNVKQPELQEMEVGFDITPLLSYAEPGKPCRLFFILETDDVHKAGYGRVSSVSFIDYNDGIVEIPAEETSVNIPVQGNIIIPVTYISSFNKIAITTEELPVPSGGQINTDLEASGGKPPFCWSLLHHIQETSTDSLFPLVYQQLLQEQSTAVHYSVVPIPFEFPFLGEEYDTVYMNSYGFISFHPDQIPSMYLVDPDEMMRNNAMIAPLLTMNVRAGLPVAGMWYQEDPGRVTFRWSTKVSGNETGSDVDFALRLYPDGRYEFLYGDCSNQYLPFRSLFGYSRGDNIDYSIRNHWSLEGLSGRSFLYEPAPQPASAALSAAGTLSISGIDAGTCYPVHVKVADANGISTERIYSLSSVLDLQASFNGNGLHSYDTSHLQIIVRNKGAAPLEELILKLSGSHCIMTDSIETAVTLEAGESDTIGNCFSMIIDTVFDDGSILPFTVTAESGTQKWTRKLYLPFSAPSVSISNPVVDDGANGVLDAGEVADLIIGIKNSGSDGISNPEIMLTCEDTLVTILSPPYFSADSLHAYDTLAMKYLVSAARTAGIEDTARMVLTITGSNSFSRSFPFSLPLARSRIAILNLSPDYSSASWMALEIDELNMPRDVYNSIPGGLGDYAVAFVLPGMQPADSLNPAEENILESYLVSRGKLYMEQFDKWQKNSELAQRFLIEPDTVFGYGFVEVTGQTGTFTDSMSFSYQAWNNSATFELQPVAPAYSIFVSPSGHPLQVVYEGENYKTIASMTSFGSLTDTASPSDKKTLMKRYLDFFDIGYKGIHPLFHSDKRQVFMGDSIRFIDDSFDSITSRTWSFPGGEPSFSGLPEPVVKYSGTGTFDVSLTVHNLSDSSNIVKRGYIRVLPFTGIDEVSVSNFLIFPNPADDHFFIRSKESEKYRLSLYNIHGSRILDRMLEGELSRVNADLPAGIYIAVIITKDETIIEKIIFH